MNEEREHAQNQENEEEHFTEEQRAYIREMVEKLMEKKVLVVYGDEEKAEEVCYDEDGRRNKCRAVCCSFVFALTKRDVSRGVIKWNPKRPYFIARDEDGYCPHLNRQTLQCTVYDDRPERCRNYDCRNDVSVWEDWEKSVLSKDVFSHLPK